MIGGFCMGEVHFMISEAAKRVNVETHVLRYWEEELELTIGRTEMGHRYYTEDDVRLFNCIKELKEQGMLLKDLKEVIPEMIQAREKRKSANEVKIEVSEEKPSKLQLALQENNVLLQEAITQSVVKEIGFLFQAAERQEEDRYKRLDSLIRQQQAYRKEVAKMPLRNLRRIFEG